jgi:regulator of ribonuclease activity A
VAPSIVSTPDLCDDFGHKLVSCNVQFRQFGGRRQFFGPIRTIRCVYDNLLVRRTLETRGDGSVLVVDGQGYLGSSLLGDNLGGMGAANGWSGIVIYGALRDSAALAKLDIGVKALGTNPRRSAENGVGEVDVVVSFGGATFTPGHWLYSDEDGLLVSAERLLSA